MSIQARLLSGTPRTMDYTRPETAVAPGGVVIISGIAGVDVCGGPADEVGSLAIGGAIFTVPKIAEHTFLDGDSVYWNATAGDGDGAATASVEDALLGICRGGAAEDAATVNVELMAGAVPHS